MGGRVKLRCGGLSVPGPEQVALVLVACHGASVVMKATAGLHHPLPSAGQHGFLNLLCAATHVRCRGAGESRVTEMLEAQALGELPFDELERRGRARHAARAVQGVRLVLLARARG